MFTSSRISTSTLNESLLLNTIKRMFIECDQYDLSTDKIQLLTDKIYQIWMKSSNMTNINNRHSEGYRIIDYLEQLLKEKKMNDNFFILIINTLSKNVDFYSLLLNDYQHFENLFNSLTIQKPIYLMRYIELLYYYCPNDLISTIGHRFYRFILDKHLINCLHQIPNDIDWLAIFSNFIYQYYENQKKYSQTIMFNNENDAMDYSKYVIDTLLHHHLKIKSVKDFNYDMKLINKITKTIQILWEENLSINNSNQNSQDEFTTIQLRSIEYLFSTMSNKKYSRIHSLIYANDIKTMFSSTILSLFSHINLDAADLTLKTMFSDGRLNGEHISMITKCLIELIDAPLQLIQSMSCETWIIGLCTALITFNQHEYLRKLIDETILFLFNHLFYVETMENSFQILFWFIRYDKRIQTFQILLDHLPNIIEKLKEHSNNELKTKIIELCYMGIAIHPEYNNLSNENIYLKQILYSFPQPDLNILINHKNIHTKLHSISFQNDNSIKTRVGIVNLGNTCYVNSVLQALYQCDSFRNYILEKDFNQQNVLKELQMIFGQLNLSKRPYINAINLIKIARPPWFIINEQQDCAEFLGYLLDTIKDEEKTDKNLTSYEIERFFTIRTCQINRCQRCFIESYRQETSNYLFLPIPTFDNQHADVNSNQSGLITKDSLKFYEASNENSISDDQARSIATTLVQSNKIHQPVISNQSSNTSIRSHSSPLSSNNSTLNLQIVFDFYFQKEELKDDNQYRCEHCHSSLQNAERYTILQTSPEYLILSLNRFEYDKNTNLFRKVFTKMNYPKVLNVNIYPSENSRINPILTKYCLVLIIVHTGYTLHGGHYYVYAREIKPLLKKQNQDEQEDYFSNDEWFLLNDDLVTLTSYESMIENCAQYSSATPYILFYKRIDQQIIDDMKVTKRININQNLHKKINEDNLNFEHEQTK